MSRWSRSKPSLAWRVVLATTLAASGCAGLPRIDPSGRRVLIWPERPAPTAPSLPSLGNIDVPPVFAGDAPPVAPPPQPAGGPLVGSFGAAPQPVANTSLAPVKERLSITPTRLLAPVGSEVILKAGVCADNGYLRTNRRIEWMLGQEGTGQFVTIGEQGQMDILRLPWQRPNKHDNSYAVGYTAPYNVCLRRGTADETDDLQVERGEAWITLTSASEGVSYVTATAPETENWDTRRATTTVYWVDAQWRLPAPLALQPGQTGTLTTTVTRQSDGAPVKGWLVRYEVLRGETARLGYESGQTSEVETDDQGRASVQVTPTDDQPGDAQVRVTVIRPATSAPMPSPRLEVGGGDTTVTWTPSAVPPVIDGGAPIEGPPTDSTPTPPSPFEPPPRPDDGGSLGQPDPGVGPRVEVVLRRETTGPIRVGDPIPVTITLLNTGDAPAENLTLSADYDRGLSSPQDTRGLYRMNFPSSRLYDLGPGDSNVVELDFNAVTAGRHCYRVTVNGDRMDQAFDEQCFEIEAPLPPARPNLRIETALDAVREVGQTFSYLATVYNDGATTVDDLAVEILTTPELNPIQATQGWREIAKGFRWENESIPAGGSAQFVVEFRCDTPATQAKVTTFAVLDGNEDIHKTDAIEIRPARQAPVDDAPRSGLRGVISSTANPARVGQRASLNLAITNTTGAALENVQFRLRLPPQMRAEQVGGAFLNQNAVEFDPIATLAAGETHRAQITYTPVEQGVVDVLLDMRVGGDGVGVSESTSVSISPR